MPQYSHRAMQAFQSPKGQAEMVAACEAMFQVTFFYAAGNNDEASCRYTYLTDSNGWVATQDQSVIVHYRPAGITDNEHAWALPFVVFYRESATRGPDFNQYCYQVTLGHEALLAYSESEIRQLIGTLIALDLRYTKPDYYPTQVTWELQGNGGNVMEDHLIMEMLPLPLPLEADTPVEVVIPSPHTR